MIRMLRVIRAAVVSLAVLNLAAEAARAGAAAVPTAETAGVEVGFAGVYRTGSWTPVTVVFSDAAAAPQAVRVAAEDPDGQQVWSPPASVVAEPGGRALARLAVRFGRPFPGIMVETVSGPGAAAIAGPTGPVRQQLPTPLPSSESVFLTLGDLPAADRASRLLSREDGSRPRVVACGADAVSAGMLPGPDARGYDGVDTIIVCGRIGATLDERATRGIDAWVRQGGQLVLLSGTTAVALSEAVNGAARWLPGEVSRLVPVRRGNAIETYARASRPLEKSAVANLQIPLFRQPQAIEGSVETFEGRGPGDLPLVVRRAYGLGTVVWAGVDLDGPPFTNWSGSESFLVELVRGRRAARDAGRSGETMRGALDLAGQLRQTVDRFIGVAPIPFEVIAGLGALYVACLYPLDWWLVSGRRRAGPPAARPWLAWVSLPLVVIAASGVAWSAGDRWKGRAWRTSAAEMVDLDLESGLLRAVGFLGLWSPENAALDIHAELGALELARKVTPSAAAVPSGDAGARDRGAGETAAVSWFAPSGRGIGATDAAAAHPSLAARDYTYGDTLATFSGVPVAASSSRLFEAEIVAHGAGAVSSTLAKEGQGTLRGAVVSRLPFELRECVLMHAGWLYDVGTLGPGASFEPASTRGPRSLAGALTRRALIKDREVAARWDLAERDPLRILEVAGFHAAAGGSGYTSREPGRLARLDLSPLLPLDRAVLVGRGPAAVRWTCHVRPSTGGQATGGPAGPSGLPSAAERVCLWRIVIPLERQPEPTSAPASSRPSPATVLEAPSRP